MCVMSVSGSNAALALSSSRKSTDRKSTSRPLGSSGLRRETPTTSQPAERNFSIAATPSRPLAPVTRTLFRTLMIFLDLVLMRRFARRRCLYGRCVNLDPFCDVGRGIAYPARLQHFDQSRLVDDRSTRCVDESRRRLHQRELGRPDQPFGTTT